MNTKPVFTSTKKPTLSPKEYAVIRSYMLGLSEESLKQLMQIECAEINEIWSALFAKFKLNNTYVLIRKVIQLGLIEVDNYLPETIKSSTLDFINFHQDQFPLMSPKSEGEVLTYLHINDLFLLGIDNVVENLHLIPKHILRKHLYRVQKLSSKYYEFRLANKYINHSFEYPEYVRINNFGNKKTGWITHNPVKV